MLLVLASKYSSLKNENRSLREKVAEYESALDEANENIEEANSIIEEAQSYAWESYEEMGGALENLYTVDIVLTNRQSIFKKYGLPPLPKLPSLPKLF